MVWVAGYGDAPAEARAWPRNGEIGKPRLELVEHFGVSSGRLDSLWTQMRMFKLQDPDGLMLDYECFDSPLGSLSSHRMSSSRKAERRNL